MPSLAQQPPPTSSSATDHLRRGLDLARGGNLPAAEAELLQAVALAPDRADFLSRLGGVLAMQQKFTEALPYFENALRLQPGDPAIRRNLAASQWGTGQLREARINLELVLKREPGDVESIFLLGMIAERSKEYERAAKLLNSISAAVEQRPDGIVALANASYRTGLRSDAARLLRGLAELRATPASLFRGAQRALEAGDYGTAEGLLASIRLKDVEASEPQQRKTRELNYLDLAKALADAGQPGAALEAINLGLREMPHSAILYANRGFLETQLHRYVQAVESYFRATELAPPTADTALGLAMAQAAAGMVTKAEQTLRKGIQDFSGDALMHLQYGTLLLQLAERGEPGAQLRGSSELERAIALDPSLAEPHYRLGNLALANDKPVEAVRHLEVAAKLEPKSSKTYLALARAYSRTNRSADASRSQATFLALKAEEENVKHSPSGMSIP